MTKVDCLKKIYTALGGESSAIANDFTVCDVLHKIGEAITTLPIGGGGIEELDVTIENALGEDELFTLTKPTELKAVFHKADKYFTIDYRIEFITAQSYTQTSSIADWFPRSLILSLPNKTISKIYETRAVVYGKASAGSDMGARFFINSKLDGNKIKFEFDANGLNGLSDKTYYAFGTICGVVG